jgi:uncharacterized membrane protein
MNVALWIVQGFLAVIFILAGVLKATTPKDKLLKQLPWVKDYSYGTVKLIGVFEFLGGVGLIVPWLTGIVRVLTPIAAVGICIIMALALATEHLKKKEYKEVAFNTTLLILAAFVAVGRF